MPTLKNVQSFASSSSVVIQKSMPKVYGKANMVEFSGFLFADSSGDPSIGQYFSNRCPDISEVAPTKFSPDYKPVALIANSTESGSVKYTFILRPKSLSITEEI